MYGNSGCLGIHKKLVITSVNEQGKGLKGQGQDLSKPSILEDFFTTSTCDMDNSTVQSQRSMSSISVVNQDSSGTASNPSEFVNHGLILWNQTRQHWMGNKKSEFHRSVQPREPKLNWNATYENILGSNKPFPQPIPLSEMVDFLVDIWGQEGMYD